MECSVLLTRQIARTLLGNMRQLTVPEYPGLRILRPQGLQQLIQGVLLGLGTGVGRMAVLVETSLIDDAKGTPVVTLHMDAMDALREQGDDVAIASHVPVIGHLTPLLLSTVNQRFHAEGAVAAVSHAVHDEILHDF